MSKTEKNKKKPKTKIKLLCEGEVATFFGVGVSTIRRWRYDGNGPKYIKLANGSVRYHPNDIEQHINNNRYKSTYEQRHIEANKAAKYPENGYEVAEC